MRTGMLTVIALTGLGLSGCSLWTKSDAADKTAQSEPGLRSTPGQAYAFDGQVYDIEIYDTASQYTGYDVELYDASQYYYYGYNDRGVRPLTVIENTDPRKAAFVKLNGTSQTADWQNCESRHNGYLRMTEFEARLDPEFEVCMRNKGYVLTSEAGFVSGPTLSAETAGLRRSFPQNTHSATSSAYFR